MVCARSFIFVFLTLLVFSFVLTMPASNQTVNGTITQISKKSLVYDDPLLFIFCFFIKCSKITVHFHFTILLEVILVYIYHDDETQVIFSKKQEETG